jgi:uncharacterized membrane protein YhhN
VADAGNGTAVRARWRSPRLAPVLAAVPFCVVSAVHVVALATAAGSGAGTGTGTGTGTGSADAIASAITSAEVAGATKPWLMPALALVLVVALARGPHRWRASVAVSAGLALLFSWLGDLSLSVTDGGGFLIGLACFLLAHVGWIAVLVRRPLAEASVARVPGSPRLALGARLRIGGGVGTGAGASRWPAALLLGWWLAFVAILAPHTTVLLGPVALYGLVLGAMCLAALSRGALTGAGGVAFVVSDSILGLNTFLPGFGRPVVDAALIDAVIMVGYLLAQGLLVAGVVRALGRSDD